MPEARAPRVFISYAHVSPEHCDRLRRLADNLRRDGLDVALDQYETSPAELLERGLPVAGEYPASVATTWELNFAKVDQLAAGDVRRVSAFFAPEAIPVEIVRAVRPSESDDDALALDEILAPLASYSLKAGVRNLMNTSARPNLLTARRAASTSQLPSGPPDCGTT